MSIKNNLTVAERRKKQRRQIYEICIFSMLGALMFCSKILMEAFYNIHLLGMLTIAYTVVFRARALIPIYIYVFLNGLYAGFDLWWIPYLYIWTILWGVTMLLPKNMKPRTAMVVYPIICSLHGFAFGLLYSPAQALMYGFSFEQTLAWVVVGFFRADIIQGVSNIFMGMLVFPMTELMKKLINRAKI